MKLGQRKCKLCGKVINADEDYGHFLGKLDQPMHRECELKVM